MHGKLIAVSQLYHPAQIHNDYPVRNVLNDREVMSDEQICETHLILQILKHVDDLRLNGYVKGRDRLVADDELRIYREGSRDTDTLSLSAREFVRVAVRMLGIQSYSLKKADDPVVSLLLV